MPTLLLIIHPRVALYHVSIAWIVYTLPWGRARDCSCRALLIHSAFHAFVLIHGMLFDTCSVSHTNELASLFRIARGCRRAPLREWARPSSWVFTPEKELQITSGHDYIGYTTHTCKNTRSDERFQCAAPSNMTEHRPAAVSWYERIRSPSRITHCGFG